MKRLKISVTLLIVVTLMFGLGGLSLLSYYQINKLLLLNLERSISSITLSSGAEVSQWLNSRKSEIELMANTPLIQSGNQEEIIVYLDNEVQRNKLYEQFFITDTKGYYYLNSRQTGSVLDRDYFQQVMATGHTVISDPLYSRGSGNQIIVVAVPIKKEGRVVGLLGGSVKINELSQTIATDKLMADSKAFMIRQDGLIISHPREDLIMQYNVLDTKNALPELKATGAEMIKGKTGFSRINFLGEEKYIAYTPIKGVNWSLGITIPTSYITNQLYFLPVFFIVITVFFGIITVTLLSRWLVLPLTRLAKITSKVTDKLGDNEELNWIESPVSEVNFLTNNFQDMVAALKTNFQELKIANSNLEEEIDERIAIQKNLKRSFEELAITEVKLRHNYQRIQENERALQESERRFRLMLENVQLITMMIDQEGCISFCNDFMLELAGFNRSEVIGRNLFELFIPVEERDETRWKFDEMLESGVLWFPLTCQVLTKEGQNHLVNWNNTMLFDHSGCVIGFASIGEDITERKKMEEKLKFQSLHDSLTGLFNRTHFEESLQHLENDHIKQVGIIVCDVDGLKFVNDTLGHSTGDKLLKLAATTVKKCFQKEEAISRIGGDEFAVILSNYEFSEVEHYCRVIKSTVADYNLNNPQFPLSLSVGFAVGKTTERRVSDIFKEADNNMYREKLHRSQSTRSALVQALMKALEARDFITEGHAERLQELVFAMGKAIGVSDRRLVELRLLAQFHDIGKVGVPDRILLKPTALTSEEYAEMQRHCEIGHRIAQSAPDLIPIADWILKHHEWWNGGGYPLGLKGEAIPLECRILAITDAFDAMTSDRPYRKGMPPEEAVEELRRRAGTQFDPELIAVFVNIFTSGETSVSG